MIGKVIHSLLSAYQPLTDIIDSISPYVLSENTELPAVIYTVDALEPEYDKDGWVVDECKFSVAAFCKDYSYLQSISRYIRQALELKKGTHEFTTIGRIYLTGQSEGYHIDTDVFVNRLTFQVQVLKY
ncbi:MAG TPA: hypothetical protein VK179_13840 [Bacteroidales bacterium]|nr:hypothetical protein [Bacteroidales bacterium]